MKPVLQTRYVGQAPDLRHPLAPPEHVFEVEKPSRLHRTVARVAMYVMLFGVGDLAVRALNWTIGYESQSFMLPIWLAILMATVGAATVYLLGRRRAPY